MFQVALNKYGPFTEWMAFYDIDEFFVPSTEFFPNFADESHTSIPRMLHDLFIHEGQNDPNMPGIMFDSQEMGCPFDHLPFLEHAAISANCVVTGLRFVEYSNGHGKMFLRPKNVHILSTPHR